MSRELVTGAVPCQSPGMRMPLALALSAVLALSACSDDGKDDGPSAKEAAEAYAKTDPKKIQDESNAALAKVDSLRAYGEFGGGDSAIAFDLAMDSEGACSGTVTVPGLPAVEVLAVDGDRWFKAPDDFWEEAAPAQAEQIIDVIDDRWIVANADFDDYFQFCDFEGITEDDDDDKATDLEVEGVEEYEGQQVVAVSFDQDGDEGTAYVLGEEPHYIARVVVEGQADLSYTDFNEPVDAEAPDEDDTIDLSTL